MPAGRDRVGWERIADVQVPRGVLWVILLAAFVRQRHMNAAIKEFDATSSRLGTLIGTRWKEGDERDRHLVDLQMGLEQLTRRLVVLTIVLALVGVAGVGVSIWAILR